MASQHKTALDFRCHWTPPIILARSSLSAVRDGQHPIMDRHTRKLALKTVFSFTDAPSRGTVGHVRARARPPLRRVLLPPRQGRGDPAHRAARARARAAALHAARAPHAAPPPHERGAPHPEALPRDVRVTSARPRRGGQDPARPATHRALVESLHSCCKGDSGSWNQYEYINTRLFITYLATGIQAVSLVAVKRHFLNSVHWFIFFLTHT